jgi:threonine/homoserine/homoserine lactone efflux protein
MISLPLGILLGLSLAAPPGPINAIIAYEALRSPFHGTAVGFGAMSADAIFFIITYAFSKIIPDDIIPIFYFLGGVIMLYLAVLVLRSKSSSRSVRGNYFIGLTIGLTNPYQITWWLTAGLSMIKEFTILIIPGFFLGILIWIIAFPLFISRLSLRFEIQKYIKIFSFVILLIFGFLLIYYGLKIVMNIF